MVRCFYVRSCVPGSTIFHPAQHCFMRMSQRELLVAQTHVPSFAVICPSAWHLQLLMPHVHDAAPAGSPPRLLSPPKAALQQRQQAQPSLLQAFTRRQAVLPRPSTSPSTADALSMSYISDASPRRCFAASQHLPWRYLLSQCVGARLSSAAYDVSLQTLPAWLPALQCVLFEARLKLPGLSHAASDTSHPAVQRHIWVPLQPGGFDRAHRLQSSHAGAPGPQPLTTSGGLEGTRIRAGWRCSP